MNTLLREAAASVQGGWLLGVTTVVFFVFFLAWVWWTYHPDNEAMMDEVSRMPLSDGGEG